MTVVGAGRTLADPSSDRTFRESPLAESVVPSPSIVELIRAGVLDAELAATCWVLLEGRTPLLVAQADSGDRSRDAQQVLDALLAFVPPSMRRVELAGASERFDWLPQASELGWSVAEPSPFDPSQPAAVRPDSTVLVQRHEPWGPEARIAIRAAAIGYGLVGTIQGDRLEDVLATLRMPPVAADDDELSRLGIVLIVRRTDDGRLRVAAAHYLRPTARDEHGHVQRLGPAVLATWDATRDRHEQFGWGITPELAARLGRRAGDLELDIDHRRTFLVELAAGSGHGANEAIRAYRSIIPALPTTT